MRLNFKHRRYIAGQFIKDQLDGGSYDEPKYWAAFILLDGIN